MDMHGSWNWKVQVQGPLLIICVPLRKSPDMLGLSFLLYEIRAQKGYCYKLLSTAHYDVIQCDCHSQGVRVCGRGGMD